MNVLEAESIKLMREAVATARKPMIVNARGSARQGRPIKAEVPGFMEKTQQEGYPNGQH